MRTFSFTGSSEVGLELLVALVNPDGSRPETSDCVPWVIDLSVPNQRACSAVILVPREHAWKLVTGQRDAFDWLTDVSRMRVYDKRWQWGSQTTWQAPEAGLTALDEDSVDGSSKYVQSVIVKAIEKRLEASRLTSKEQTDPVWLDVFGRRRAKMLTANTRGEKVQVVYSRPVVEEELEELLPTLPTGWREPVREGAHVSEIPTEKPIQKTKPTETRVTLGTSSGTRRTWGDYKPNMPTLSQQQLLSVETDCGTNSSSSVTFLDPGNTYADPCEGENGILACTHGKSGNDIDCFRFGGYANTFMDTWEAAKHYLSPVRSGVATCLNATDDLQAATNLRASRPWSRLEQRLLEVLAKTNETSRMRAGETLPLPWTRLEPKVDEIVAGANQTFQARSILNSRVLSPRVLNPRVTNPSVFSQKVQELKQKMPQFVPSDATAIAFIPGQNPISDRCSFSAVTNCTSLEAIKDCFCEFLHLEYETGGQKSDVSGRFTNWAHVIDLFKVIETNSCRVTCRGETKPTSLPTAKTTSKTTSQSVLNSRVLDPRVANAKAPSNNVGRLSISDQ